MTDSGGGVLSNGVAWEIDRRPRPVDYTVQAYLDQVRFWIRDLEENLPDGYYQTVELYLDGAAMRVQTLKSAGTGLILALGKNALEQDTAALMHPSQLKLVVTARSVQELRGRKPLGFLHTDEKPEP